MVAPRRPTTPSLSRPSTTRFINKWNKRPTPRVTCYTSTTATSQKEEAVVVNENHNAVIKETDETKYSVEEAPLEMQQNDQSKPRERERETLFIRCRSFKN
jgi:hypothetical protein